MNIYSFLEISKEYNNCPQCGSDKIGNSEGKLTVEDDTFARECKCGFKITLDENGKKLID